MACARNLSVEIERVSMVVGASSKQSRHRPQPSTFSSRAQGPVASGSCSWPAWRHMTMWRRSVRDSSTKERRAGPPSSQRSGDELASRSHGLSRLSSMKSKPKSSKQPRWWTPTSCWQARTAVRTIANIRGHVHLSQASCIEPVMGLSSSIGENVTSAIPVFAHSRKAPNVRMWSSSESGTTFWQVPVFCTDRFVRCTKGSPNVDWSKLMGRVARRKYGSGCMKTTAGFQEQTKTQTRMSHFRPPAIRSESSMYFCTTMRQPLR
mmetsp:Transcript_55485/g.104342  ORF Transcript_55485/g.104342 Transcript_55485/m.104342 type:complete len:264 (-) Transcript_55485:472-1263(-)